MKFREWQRRLLIEKLKDFKPLDEKTRKIMETAGWEYDEELSKIAYTLMR
ncbi:MAG: hypothetical protein QXJ19_00235 [Candidatus Bathyarchaeia archaeon]